MRAFIAIDLPNSIKEALKQLQQRLRESGSDVKWTEPENFHVTLKFLGEINEEQRAPLEEGLAKAARANPSCLLQLRGLGSFPSGKAPKVLWVGARSPIQSLAELAYSVDAQARLVGLKSEDRPFTVHVTLGRVRSPQNRSALVKILSSMRFEHTEPFMVDCIRLYQSQIRSEGPRYTLLREFALEDKGVACR